MSSPAGSSSSVKRASHSLIKVFKGHSKFVTAVAYFPDGRHIASGSWDKTIRIWNVDTGQQEGEDLEHDSEVKAIAIAPDGRKIAAEVDNELIVWDVVRRKSVQRVKIEDIEERTSRVAFSPDGRWIAAASSLSASIRLWDVDTGSPVGELRHVDTVRCLAFSPDRAHIATGSFGGSFRVLEISTGKTVVGPVKSHADLVLSLVYSPDGRLLVTGSDDGSIRVWDSATGRGVGRPMLLPGHRHWRIAISADGKKIASIASEGTTPLWDLETRLQIGDLSAGWAVDWARDVAFSPNGRFVISTCMEDVHLWDTVAVPNSAVSGAPNWKNSVTVSWDTAAVPNSAVSGAPNQKHSVTLSPGERLVISGGSAVVHLRDAAEALDSAPSPPTTNTRESFHSVVPSAPVITHPSLPPPQQEETPSKDHRDTSSLSSSILDLPAVVQPEPERAKEVERAPSIGDWDSYESHHRPTTEPTETQQEPQAEPGSLNAPPAAVESGNWWMRIMRRRWRHLLSRKLRAQVQTAEDSPHSPTKGPPTSRKHPNHEPATDPSVIPMQGDHTGDEAHMGNPDARAKPLTRFRNRLRRGSAPRDESGPCGQKKPTPGVVDVAGGRDKLRLMMSPDRERYGVPPPEPVELPPIATRPPSFFEIEEDPLEWWSWSRELRELICCYWCFPRDARPV